MSQFSIKTYNTTNFQHRLSIDKFSLQNETNSLTAYYPACVNCFSDVLHFVPVHCASVQGHVSVHVEHGVHLTQISLFSFKKNRQPLDRKTLLCALFNGVVDAVSSALDSWAYSYTDEASISLILVLQIPASMLFSALLVKEKYSYAQVITAFVVCLLVALYSLIDSQNTYESDSNKLLGDILEAAAAIGYGFEACFNEKFAQKAPV